MRRLYNELSSSVQMVIKVGAVVGAMLTIYGAWIAGHTEYANAEEVQANFATMQQQFIWIQQTAAEEKLDEYELQLVMESEEKYQNYYKAKIEKTQARLDDLDKKMEATMQVK